VALRGFLHRLLGGETDDDGRPVADADEWVEVFDGVDPDISTLRDAMQAEGIEVRLDNYVPIDGAWGASAGPRIRIFVRAADTDRANELLDAVPHLGRRQA
jgi:hypothetical protein